MTECVVLEMTQTWSIVPFPEIHKKQRNSESRLFI
jgi:hypothetical protein